MQYDYDYDFLVFIGRFQPFHSAHRMVIEKALKQARNVIVLVGSSNTSRSLRNPFTFEERAGMIQEAFDGAFNDEGRLHIAALDDNPYNDQAWIKSVQETVRAIIAHQGFADAKIGLIGHKKDDTSFYLSKFPQWGNVSVANINGIDATNLRDLYFGQAPAFPKLVPPSTLKFLIDFKETKAFETLCDEYDHIYAYKRSWEFAPYPPVFVTVDAVLVQAGHILVVRRKAAPGENLLALPGGFVEQHQYIKDALLAELRQETKIKVPEPVLLGSIKGERVFDHPNRSQRGRTITHAFHIELAGSATGLPKVKGGDDAKEAFFVPLGDLDPRQMFEDHYHIIQAMLGL